MLHYHLRFCLLCGVAITQNICIDIPACYMVENIFIISKYATNKEKKCVEAMDCIIMYDYKKIAR
jgi:hypothetical protein